VDEAILIIFAAACFILIGEIREWR